LTDAVQKRRAPLLDGRLSAAIALAENCRYFADIGADHGRLSAVMLLQDENRRAFVADISSPALDKAKALLGRLGLSHRACFAVSDGLAALDDSNSPDTVFILGMGGETVSGILRRGHAKLHRASLILGAQTDLPLVRQTLCDIGYSIRREVIASEAGRDYVLIRATAAETAPAYTEEEILLGPVLLKELPANWEPVLTRREKLLAQGIGAMKATQLEKDRERLERFEREMVYVQRVLVKLRKEDEP